MAAQIVRRTWLTVVLVFVLWAVGSTGVGYAAMLLSGQGHAGQLFVWAAWFVAAAAIPIHVVLVVRKRTHAKNDHPAI